MFACSIDTLDVVVVAEDVVVAVFVAVVAVVADCQV